MTKDLNKIHINEILKDLCNYRTVDTFMVSIDGHKSIQYSRFEYLLSVLSDAEFIQHLDSPYPNLRAYSFWALVRRNPPNVESHLCKLSNDSKTILFSDGCITRQLKLSQFAIHIILYEQGL